MLFNSVEFIFAFLPLTVGVFYLLALWHKTEWCIVWLVLASLFFYGWWKPVYLWLIVGSVGVNYFIAGQIHLRADRGLGGNLWMCGGVALNIVLLAYFKYTNFLIDNLNLVSGSDWRVESIILPLAISFFTFQQIAFLVDVQRNRVRDHSFVHYALFVTFFPQLIAGPIVHHSEMLPQFHVQRSLTLRFANIALGATVFIIGLFKKTVFADGIANYSTPMFDGALQGVAPTLLDAWGGALAYTFQLYFDFSGYSDMALGLGLLFGIKLPINFFSPYKARNITEFWNMWHMTLSRFLRDHLYIPLGGSRHGPATGLLAMLVTMLLGGLWHGAGWNFVIWGGLHGGYIVVHRTWRWLACAVGMGDGGWVGAWTGRVITTTAVVFAWVFFRAESFDAALLIINGMIGGNGVAIPAHYAGFLGSAAAPLEALGVNFQEGLLTYFRGAEQIWFIAALIVVCWGFPNTAQIMRRCVRFHNLPNQKILATVGSAWLVWRFHPVWAVVLGLGAALALKPLFAGSPSEFLYFQF